METCWRAFEGLGCLINGAASAAPFVFNYHLEWFTGLVDELRAVLAPLVYALYGTAHS